MTQLELLTEQVIAHPELKALLKSVKDDDEFVDVLIREGKTLGYHVSAEAIRDQMKTDRVSASSMDVSEFEDVAGTMLGARLSGGHQSGASC